MSQPRKPRGKKEKDRPKPNTNSLEEIFDNEEEFFMTMTPQERAAWEKMMKTRIESLKKNQAEFQKWKDNLTRRRMFVYSRIRKLYAAQMDRFRFVLKMGETVKILKDNKNNDTSNDQNINDVNSNDNSNKDDNVDNNQDPQNNPPEGDEVSDAQNNNGNKNQTSEPKTDATVAYNEGNTPIAANSNSQESNTDSNNIPKIVVDDGTNQTH